MSIIQNIRERGNLIFILIAIALIALILPESVSSNKDSKNTETSFQPMHDCPSQRFSHILRQYSTVEITEL